MSQFVPKVEIVVHEDLGPEAIKRLTVIDFPLVVINDFQGMIICIFPNSVSGVFLEYNNQLDNK